MNSYFGRLIKAVTIASVGSVTSSVWAAGLPQDHPYQRTLRAYLATLNEATFDVEVRPLTIRDKWLGTDDEMYRLWVLCQQFPDATGLTVPSRNFVLTTIEGPEHVLMRSGTRGWNDPDELAVDPMNLVWWAGFEFPGNPYFNLKAVRARAFVVAAVDMMMLDKLHESGNDWVANARRSDFLTGALIWLSYVYWKVKPSLPDAVREAYETGLGKFVARLEEWGPTGVNDNMDMHALVAAAYLEKALGNNNTATRARAYCKRVLTLFHPAGIIRDAGGLEASYNGIALYHLAWANAVAGWPEFKETLRSVTHLKSSLTFPEPDGRHFWGPTHFNTRTSADSANDQWARPQRDLAVAMYEPAGFYLARGARNDVASLWAVPQRNEIPAAIAKSFENMNRYQLQARALAFPAWQATWWGDGKLNYAYDHFATGFYGRAQALVKSNDPLTRPILTRPGPAFIELFPPESGAEIRDEDRDALLVAKFPTYAAAVYTGPLGFHPYMNFGGGCLSAFWTPKAGTTVLGRTGKPNKPEDSPQDWRHWRLWPTHAVSGETADGRAFSSARVRRRTSTITYDRRDGGTLVTVRAPIGKKHDNGHAVEKDCLEGEVAYTRSIGVGERGVAVKTRIKGDGTDAIAELYEILPLALFDSSRQALQTAAGPAYPPHAVFLEIDGQPVKATATAMSGVTAVSIQRFEGTTQIRFAKPQRVRLGEVWEDWYMSRMRVQNLLIDLLPERTEPVAFGEYGVEYLISP